MCLDYSTNEYGGQGPEDSMRRVSAQRVAYFFKTASHCLRLARGNKNDDCHWSPTCPPLTLLLSATPRVIFFNSAANLSTSSSGPDFRSAAIALAFFCK